MTTARIGLVSDSHGRFSCLEQMVDQAPDVCCWIHGGDYCNDAEDLAAGPVDGVHIRDAALGLHIDGALLGIDPEPAEPGGAAAEVGHELHFKAAAVQALQDHLAQLAQDHFVHGVSP